MPNYLRKKVFTTKCGQLRLKNIPLSEGRRNLICLKEKMSMEALLEYDYKTK